MIWFRFTFFFFFFFSSDKNIKEKYFGAIVMCFLRPLFGSYFINTQSSVKFVLYHVGKIKDFIPNPHDPGENEMSVHT